MKLRVISSSSAGNAYLLHNDKEALLIECGVNIDRIKSAIGYSVQKVVGCLVTHNHLDHCKAIKKVMGLGIHVWASAGTHTICGTVDHHRARVTYSGDQFQVGGFKVKAFDVKHDAAEPLGYLIHHEETGLILFLTDTCYCEYKFEGLNNIIIEANYCQDIIDAKMSAGKFVRDRVIQSHMNLQTCRDMLLANDLTAVNNIVLIHLSDKNSDEDRFRRTIKEATGKLVTVAVPGLSIPFNKTPF